MSSKEVPDGSGGGFVDESEVVTGDGPAVETVQQTGGVETRAIVPVAVPRPET